MAITTWGPRVLEPGNSAFWRAVQGVRPALYKDYNPWDRINEPLALRAMLLDGGVQPNEVLAESSTQPLDSPEDFWTIVLGSGYRSVIEQLDRASLERVRHAALDFISKQGIRSVETNAIYAFARKP